jgi:hypothetical protein
MLIIGVRTMARRNRPNTQALHLAFVSELAPAYLSSRFGDSSEIFEMLETMADGAIVCQA